MKKTVFLFGLLCLAPLAFAQKADVSYWSGMPQYKTYEPWMYEIVNAQRDENKAFWWQKLASFFGNPAPESTPQTLKQAQGRTWNRTLTRLKELAQTQGKSEEQILLRYAQLQNLIHKNPLLGPSYALWVPSAAADDVNHLSREGFELVKRVLAAAPENRAARPQPAAAFKVQNDFVAVEFKTASEIVHMGFDLTKHTLEIYQNMPLYGIKGYGVKTDLMDLTSPFKHP